MTIQLLLSTIVCICKLAFHDMLIKLGFVCVAQKYSYFDLLSNAISIFINIIFPKERIFLNNVNYLLFNKYSILTIFK